MYIIVKLFIIIWIPEPNAIYTLPRREVCREGKTGSLNTCASQQFKHTRNYVQRGNQYTQARSHADATEVDICDYKI